MHMLNALTSFHHFQNFHHITLSQYQSIGSVPCMCEPISISCSFTSNLSTHPTHTHTRLPSFFAASTELEWEWGFYLKSLCTPTNPQRPAVMSMFCICVWENTLLKIQQSPPTLIMIMHFIHALVKTEHNVLDCIQPVTTGTEEVQENTKVQHHLIIQRMRQHMHKINLFQGTN